MAKFLDEEEGRAEAAEQETLRRNKVLAEAGEILGATSEEVIARVTGVSAEGGAGDIK